jgi:lactoylglutathione lyase
MEQNIKLTVPFFSVTNMQTSLQFYCDGLGFTIKNQWTPRGEIEWCRLERDEVAIMLQQPRKPRGETSEPSGTGITITYQCVDALALYQEFFDKAINAQEPFVGNSLWVVAVKDPDGYRLEFASPTDVPEETTYNSWKKNKNP